MAIHIRADRTGRAPTTVRAGGRRPGPSTRATAELLEPRTLLSASDLDTAFGNGGLATGTIQGPVLSSVQEVVLQPDGKTVVAGQSGEEEERLFIARYDADGSLDPTFGTNGIHFMPGGDERGSPIRGIALAPDGKIVVTGYEFLGSNVLDTLVMRFNPDGSFDTTFNGTGQEILNGITPGRGVAVQSDGKITIGGTSAIPASTSTYDGALLRLNPNGSLDNTFGNAGIAFAPSGSPVQLFSGITIDGTGRIDAVGSWSPASGVFNFGLERFNADGSIDTGFGTNGLSTVGPGTAASNPLVDSDGNIVVGAWTVVTSSTYGVVAARLATSGALDTSFGTDGFASLGPPQTSASLTMNIGLTSAGQIMVGSAGQLARLTSSGQLDSSYNGTGMANPGPYPGTVFALAADGSAASASFVNSLGTFALTHITPAGMPDSSFDGAGYVVPTFTGPLSSESLALGLQPDGRLIAAGYCRGFAVARFNRDGSLDESFGIDGFASAMGESGAEAEVNTIAFGPDGDILVGGSYDVYSGNTWTIGFGLARFLPDGQPDPTFGSNGQVILTSPSMFSFGEYGTHLAAQADGSILICGVTNNQLAVLRLTSSGAVDGSFGNAGEVIDPAPFANVTSVQIDPLGRIDVAGIATGPYQNLILARILPTGTLDGTFAAGAGFDVNSTLSSWSQFAGMTLQADGRIVLATSYSRSPSAFDLALVRYNSNGTLDPGFGAAGVVTTSLSDAGDQTPVQSLPDGSLLVADMQSAAPFVAHFSSSGLLDTAFGQGGTALISPTQLSSEDSLLMRPDGKVLIGGYVYSAGTRPSEMAVAQLVGFTPDVVAGTAGADGFTLSQDPDHQHIDWTFGAQTGQIPIIDPAGLTLNGNGGNDTITLDYTNGNPLPDALHLNGNFTITGLQTLNGTTLDIGASTVYVNYAGSSDPLSLIRQSLANGYSGGAWDGAGGPSKGAIITRAGGGGAYGIGYADAADGSGIDPIAGTIELKYTVFGDANLDGTVNLADFLALSRNFGNSNALWDQGDFNYDGSANLLDLLALVRDFGKSLPPPTLSAGDVLLPSSPAARRLAGRRI